MLKMHNIGVCLLGPVGYFLDMWFTRVYIGLCVYHDRYKQAFLLAQLFFECKKKCRKIAAVTDTGCWNSTM